LRGFLQTPADCTSHPNWPFRATFHSLLAIPRSDLALRNRPEVRKDREQGHYRSMGYARTIQSVGLQYRVAKETLRFRFVGKLSSTTDTLQRGSTCLDGGQDKKRLVGTMSGRLQ
jgi:hypothetical protein